MYSLATDETTARVAPADSSPVSAAAARRRPVSVVISNGRPTSAMSPMRNTCNGSTRGNDASGSTTGCSQRVPITHFEPCGFVVLVAVRGAGAERRDAPHDRRQVLVRAGHQRGAHGRSTWQLDRRRSNATPRDRSRAARRRRSPRRSGPEPSRDQRSNASSPDAAADALRLDVARRDRGGSPARHRHACPPLRPRPRGPIVSSSMRWLSWPTR